MAINFPNNPTVNQTHTVGDITWTWDGTTWKSSSPFTETTHDDVVVDGDFVSEGLLKRGSSVGTYSIVADNSANWNTAHGWGNHASAGYLTSIGSITNHSDVSTTNLAPSEVLKWSGTQWINASIDSFTIDAATLDGNQPISFLRSDVATSKTSGNLTFSDDIRLVFGNDSDIQIYHESTSGGVNHIQASGGLTITGQLTAGGLTYPTTNGSSGDVLTSDGAGNVTWTAGGGGGGGGISSESDTLDSVTDRGATTTNNVSFGNISSPNGNITAGGMQSGYFTGSVITADGGLSIVKRIGGGNLLSAGYYFNNIQNTLVVDSNANATLSGSLTSSGLKLNVNYTGSPTATVGDIKRINEHPHYYDGTTWRPFYLSGTSLSATTSDVQFDDVQVRLTGETNGHSSDYIYNYVNGKHFYKGQNATVVTSPTKFGTNAIQFDGSSTSYLSCRSVDISGMAPFLWSSNAATWGNIDKRGGFPDISGDWTFETWVRFDDLTTSGVENHGIWSLSNPHATVANTKGVGVSLRRNGANSPQWLLQWSNALSVSSNGVNPSLISFHDYGAFNWQEDTWYHIAISRRASDGRMFCHINGTYVAPSAAANGEYFDTNLNLVIDSTNGSDFEFILGENLTLDATWTSVTWRHRLIGYLDDVRWTNFCRYDSNASIGVPTQAYPIAPDAPPTVDPDWNNVKLRLPFDGSIADISSFTTGNSATGTLGLVNTGQKYGTGALRTNSDQNQLVFTSGATAHNLGASTWTVEFWINFDSLPNWDSTWGGRDCIFSNTSYSYNTSDLGFGIWSYSSANTEYKFYWRNATSASLLHHDLIPSSMLIGNWNHVAVVRDSNDDIKVFFNGYLLRYNAANDDFFNDGGIPTGITADNRFVIGKPADDVNQGENGFDGFIDDFRFTTTVKYTENFTPPSGILPTTGTITNNPPGTATSGYLTYPNTNGSSGQVLTSDGSGNVIWSTVSGGLTAEADTLETVTARGSTAARNITLNGSGARRFDVQNNNSYAISLDSSLGINTNNGVGLKIGNFGTNAWKAQIDGSTGDIECGSVSIPQGKSVNFGSDFSISRFVNQNKARIQYTGPGDFTFEIDDVDFRNSANNETLMTLRNGGGVSLFYNNNIKLSSTSNGVSITGVLTSDGVSVTQGNINVVSSHLYFNNANNEQHIGWVQREGVIRQFNNRLRITGGNPGEDMAVFNVDGSVELYHDASKKIETTSTGATITGALTAGGLTYPTTNGNNGQVLTSDGAGNVTWTTVSGGGGGGTGVTTDAQGNTYAGQLAGGSFSGTDAQNNTLFGYDAGGDITTGDHNTCIGWTAGDKITTGSKNVALGSEALDACTTGSQNVAIGWEAGRSLSGGTDNVMVGDMAGRSASNWSRTIAIGPSAASNWGSMTDAIAIGDNALRNGGNYSIGIGKYAGYSLRNSEYSVYIGYRSGGVDTSITTMGSGNENVAIGRSSLGNIRDGANNTAVGANAGVALVSGSNNILIGHDAAASSASASNEVVIGDSNITKFSIPGINFVLKDNGGTPTQGHVLTVDANGEAGFAAASGGGGGGSTTLGGLTDVDLTTVAPSGGEVLFYNSLGSNWVPIPLSLGSIAEVDLTTVAPTNGQTLVYNSSNSLWEPGTISGGGGSTTLAALTDTDLTTQAPLGGDVLFYNQSNSKWIPSPFAFQSLMGVDVITTPPTNGQALVYDSSTLLWKPGTVSGGGGGSLQSRTTGTAATPSIADGGSANIQITAAKTYALHKIQTDYAAWVTLYTSNATRTSDASRTEFQDPTPGSGVIAEIITSDGAIQSITPGTIGWNDDNTPSTTAYLKVVNKSGQARPINVTLYFVALEA